MSYQPRIDEHGNECCTRIEDGIKKYGIRTASGALAFCNACRDYHLPNLKEVRPSDRDRSVHDTVTTAETTVGTYAPSIRTSTI